MLHRLNPGEPLRRPPASPLPKSGPCHPRTPAGQRIRRRPGCPNPGKARRGHFSSLHRSTPGNHRTSSFYRRRHQLPPPGHPLPGRMPWTWGPSSIRKATRSRTIKPLYWSETTWTRIQQAAAIDRPPVSWRATCHWNPGRRKPPAGARRSRARRPAGTCAGRRTFCKGCHHPGRSGT